MQSLWMIFASVMFAGMGLCVKLSADAGYAAAEIVFSRSIVSLAIMSVIVYWRGVTLATPFWRQQLKRGVTGFCSLSVYFYAIALLPLATAVTLNYSSPIFFMLLLMAFRGLRPNGGLVLALGFGFAGVAFLLHPSLTEDAWFGGAMALASALLAAMTYFDVRELGLRGEPEARTVFYFALLSTLFSLAWIACVPTLDTPLALPGLGKLIGVGVFATLAQLSMTRAYARGEVMLNASFAYSTVLFSTLFGVVFWGDRLDSMELIGMTLIIISGIAASWFSRKPAENPEGKH
jgi:S-adenosylmethionine uptake transporter